jgi:hypothetical protein
MADFHFEGVEKLLEVSFFFALTYLPKKARVWLGFSIFWVLWFGIENILNTQTQTLRKFATHTQNPNSNTRKIYEYSLFFKIFRFFRKLNKFYLKI